MEITDDTITYIWASEETGHRHLYLITSSLKSWNAATNSAADKINSNNTSLVDNVDTEMMESGAGDTLLTDSKTLPIECGNQMEYIDSGTLEPRILSKVK